MDKKVKIYNCNLSMGQGTRIEGRIVGKNLSRDHIRCTLEKEPESGKIELTTNGYWSYIPNSSFVGTEEFVVKVYISGVGEKYSTIKIDVEEQEVSTKISKFLQFEDRLKIENYEDEIVEIKNIMLYVMIHDKKLIKNDFNKTSKLRIAGTLKYVINYDVGIVPVEKKPIIWFDEDAEETSEFVPEKEVQVERESNFRTEIDLGDYRFGDDAIIEYEVKYQNYRLMDYDVINHYCAIELYINK
ncbi:Ig-like domain-containing protein [Vallitalea guaymasensis]|uniref:Ig-like domain-containing protein n=1 Tax=Vallitalea guaymasensis TaxID=1185412 RepID=UPI000DE2E6B4|nr:Ig-like domain-containing protein [Vallitalea guaymasensis]